MDNSDYSISMIIIPVLLIIVIISIYITYMLSSLLERSGRGRGYFETLLWCDVVTFLGSANGNSIPEDALHEPELLWPRWADRLEATGEIGIVRTLVAQ